MSGEYYGRENHTKFYNDYVRTPLQPTNEKYGQDHRLNDDNLSLTSSTGSTYHNKSLQKRQNQPVTGTTNNGAAVQTINNILNGITNSVNRLSELHVQLSDSPRNRVASANLSPNRYYNDVVSNPSLTGQQIPFIEQRKQIMPMPDQPNLHVTTSSTRSIAGKTKSFKRKIKDPKTVKRQSSLLTVKKNIKVDKKMKISAKPIEDHVSSRPLMSFDNKSSKHAKLVEIFHNKEAKSSDSDEGNSHKKNHHMTCDGDHLDVPNPDVPLLQLENCEDANDMNMQSKRLAQRMITGDYYDPPEAPRLHINYCQKSYQLPTIASRMKQAIPFCPAITASPSHNIGINIQQVMNILRNRQPINGISPTLAHNIGLAADRLNTRPLSTLVSSINSKTCSYVRSQQCPLSKCNLNYQQLQDLAKGIPEETQEEMDVEDSPEVKTIVITGPTGEMEIKNKNVTSWAADANKFTECTCVPQTGTDIHYIANKIKKAASGKMITSQINLAQKQLPPTLNRWNLNPKLLKRPHTTKNKSKEVPKPVPQLDKTVSDYPLNGKEKNLKEVLTHLHDEFEQLNVKYEELSKTAPEEEPSKEMVVLEEELNKKEEEITMVMTLCKEVMALKQQVKSLKKISSQCSVSQESRGTPTSATFTDYSNPQAAFHLTKLLKQIQTYHVRYKNDTDV
ncbi:unnamed protein product [Psylliodes chrysocephalus]|uniref:Uncharacterized protein n=1 Tax=Psylliodes chrysocephalus TaxID=3402493 RepID=A0A9P0GBZ1_9CUCU|nr:unnamed protein product [Psylliodes chrysocephala]